MESFGAVMDLWHSAEELGGDIEQSGNTVRKWRLRESIPSEHWLRVVAAAEKRTEEDPNCGQVTLVLLATLEARRKARPGSEAA